jgi:hypothetical protein
MGVKGTKNVTEAEFDNLKMLLKAGLANKQIKMVTNRSFFTIGRVKQASDFKDYKEITASFKKKPAPEPLPEPTLVMMENELPETPTHVEDLVAIFDKLANIEAKLDILLQLEGEKRDHAKVNRWKLTGSK